MGASKTEIFSTEQNELATLLKAMAHPARIAILQHIILPMPVFVAIWLKSWVWRRPPYRNTLKS